jgi:hypothetical protein
MLRNIILIITKLEMIQYIITRVLCFIMWVLFAIVALPFGVYMLLNEWFPVFTHDGGFLWWSIFSIVSIVAYIVLWKPLLWIIGIFQLMGGVGE